MISPLLEEVLSPRSSATPPVETSHRKVDADLTVHAEASGDDFDEEAVVFPATIAQRRFWLLDQLVPGGNPALNMPLAIRLAGPLDVRALEESFNEVIRRHEALRTTFHYEDGELSQVISPASRIRIPLIVASDFPAEERASLPVHLLTEEAHQPFNLTKGPLVRGRLVRLSPNEHLFICPSHHIVSDGWSNGIFIRELGELYTTFLHDKPSPLDEPSLHFADFSEWQNDLLEKGEFQAQTGYWRGKLSGDLPTLDLPIDRPRTPWRGRAVPAGICARPLPPATITAMKALAAREGCSPFMVMLSVFGMLLDRYSGGQTDLLIATSTANRQRLELENTIGLFVNPLLLRLNLAEGPTFGEVLRRVRQVVLEAFENADLPFEKLLEEIQPRRLQVNFLYQQDFVQTARWADLEVTPVEPGSGGAVYEWNLIVLEDGNGLRLHCEYSADLFDASTIERVLADYETLLTAALSDDGTNCPVNRLPFTPATGLSSKTERGLVVDRWRLPETSLPWLHEHFATTPSGDPTRYEALSGRVVRVLDGHGQPTPVGVPGELCITLTEPVVTVFETGDIAVRLADGGVEWIGPSGTECQVNGFRVDRRKIEAVLRSHPHVREAVVLWHDNERDEPALIAHYQGDGAPRALLSEVEIRGFLRDHLPDDWTPAACIQVESFPLTPDGRLNVEALPVRTSRGRLKSAETHDIPYLALHHQIIAIWRETLNVRSISIRDDFFALGGNSLLAMRMLNRVEQAFGKSILPATLFQRATVEHLADEILRQDSAADSREIIPVQIGGHATPVFFLHGDIAGGGFYCAKLARDLGPEQPFYALPPMEVDRPLEDRPTIEGMAAAHVAAIRSVRPRGPYIVGGFCIGGVIAFEVARQLVAQGETVEKLLVIDAEPVHRRLAGLRKGIEWMARWRGLDNNRQLYLFCRWYYLLARWDQRRKLGWRANAATIRQRIGERLRRKSVGQPNSALGLHDDSPTGWFDARLDVPLVFLWALADYRARPYAGPMTLMVSSDLLGGAEGGNPAREWRRYVSALDVVELAGDHLACITEHVSDLAATMRRCLGK